MRFTHFYNLRERHRRVTVRALCFVVRMLGLRSHTTLDSSWKTFSLSPSSEWVPGWLNWRTEDVNLVNRKGYALSFDATLVTQWYSNNNCTGSQISCTGYLPSTAFDFAGSCAIFCSKEGNSSHTCPSHLYCDEDNGYCKSLAGTPCLASAECGETQFCSNQSCTDVVKAGSDCRSHDQCGKFKFT